MSERKIFHANLFAMILLILYSSAGTKLGSIFKALNLSLPMYLVLPQILLLFMPTVVYFLITKEPVKKTLRLNKINFQTVIIVIGIALVSMPIATFLSLIAQFIFPNRIGEVVTRLGNIPLLIRLAVIALTPAICEEITMRGVALAGYDGVDVKKAAIITGLFFGMIHMDGNQFLYATALGVIFAYLVRITNSIFSSMICHFVINGTQVVMLEVSKWLMKYTNQSNEAIQNAGISALSLNEKIYATILYLTLAVICVGIIIILMKKLIKINGGDGLKPSQCNIKTKVYVNIPIYIMVGIYILIIANQLIGIYK